MCGSSGAHTHHQFLRNCRKLGQLRISSRCSEQTVEISFADTGKGMPESVVEKLGREPVTTKAKGLGLGLAISKRIIEAHGGSITIDSIVGQGTVIKLKLPLEPKLGGD